ncbi:MAG: EamA family transporter [Caldilineaceae bacterium]|nr:EamA family transporter [Caldilineaceae bacterium]MCB0145533.1 EamA family transporter [Caldilineaceae bacterium]
MDKWGLIALSIASGVIAQTIIKLGVTQPGTNENVGLAELVLIILKSPLIMGGLLLYALGALSWIAVLRRLDLSFAYPFLALNFVLITISSQFALGESVPLGRWIGVAVICIGIVLVARSGLAG